jgi:hypothetical protein
MIKIVNRPTVKTTPSEIQIIFSNGRRSFSKDVNFSAENKEEQLDLRKL